MKRKRARIATYEELMTGYGQTNSKKAISQSLSVPNILVANFNTGEVLVPKYDQDGFTEYVVQSSISENEYEEYVVQQSFSDYTDETGIAQSFSTDPVSVEQEYKMEFLTPDDSQAFSIQHSIYPEETSAITETETEYKEETQPVQERTFPPVAKAQATDDDLDADLQAILRGEKAYDPETKQIIAKTGTNPNPGVPKPVQAATPPPPVLPDTPNEHAIFDRIAQSMQYANAYDLGSIDLDQRFSDFDKLEELEKKINKKLSPEKPTETEETKASSEQLTATQFIHDLDEINRFGNVHHHEPPSFSEATARSFIIENSDLTPEARAFNPATGDKSGIVKFSVRVPNLPAGGSVRWSVPSRNSGTIQLAGKANVQNGLAVNLSGLRPGLTALDVEAKDAVGKILESVKYPICVPQFVSINEERAAFDGVLQVMNALVIKDAIIREAKTTCDALLKTINVRTIWMISPFAEKTPAHIAANMITPLTIRGNPPAGRTGLAGVTRPVAGNVGWDTGNETIDIFSGVFISMSPAVDPTESTLAISTLLNEINAIQASSIPHEALLTKIFGRLIGETMAHEIIHSLIGIEIDPTGHTGLNDIMDNGKDRTFTQRTGIENKNNSSPIDIGLFVDHGIATINRLHATNQAIVNTRFPVPPVFV